MAQLLEPINASFRDIAAKWPVAFQLESLEQQDYHHTVKQNKPSTILF
jgi:hypothetical protein